MVLTTEGLRPIEQLVVGEIVLAGDPVTGARAPRRISRTYVRRVPAVLDVTLGEAVLTCTPGHPFWIPESGGKRRAPCAPEPFC